MPMQDDTIVRTMPWNGQSDDYVPLLTREWLVANGLGGYASGTISGIASRRYHGLLIAAFPAPLGRIVMLNHMHERVLLTDGEAIDLSGDEFVDRRVTGAGFHYLQHFRLQNGLPVWRYAIGDAVLEKSILLPHQQNTVHIGYRLLEGSAPLPLELRPAIHYRPLEAAVDEVFVDVKDYALTVLDDGYSLQGGRFPSMTLRGHGGRPAFTIDQRRRTDIFFRLENARGYPAVGEHWSPGAFTISLEQGQEFTVIASTEAPEVVASLSPQQAREAEEKRRRHLLEIAHPAARTGMAAELVLAADQFIITPAGRSEEAARARAIGNEVKTVIAGYHWFTDWGRDTMISLEGLTLATGRQREAGHILRTFAEYVRDGLIPNMFPEHDKTGLYHTADATLWFFHALHRYLLITDDRDTLRVILPKLTDIVDRHLHGTLFNIGVDPKDGLLRQGQEGYQLTWMDAKVHGWVVTPRRGKAVELNALWYNALCLLEKWLREEGNSAAAQALQVHAVRARASFNQRFWNGATNCLHDVVDGEHGDDAACRPNQILAISLDHPVLDHARWPAVVGTVERALLTPLGLRSLAPDHADYKRTYTGDLRARDAAYHQGTVWGWLIGPFVDAWLKVHPQDDAGARKLLAGFERHLGEAGMGTVSEIFDAEPPYTPRGCIAQAWSVAELLRCLVRQSNSGN